jgi:phosphate transport system permease protein
MQSQFKLDVTFSQDVIAPDGKADEQTLRLVNWDKLARQALYSAIGVDASGAQAAPRSQQASVARYRCSVARHGHGRSIGLIGQTKTVWLLASGDVDALLKGNIDRDVPEARRQLDDQQVAWIDRAYETGTLARKFNTGLFTNGASSQPETAGCWSRWSARSS